MIKSIIIEQGIGNKNTSKESYATIEGGRIIGAKGKAGITQYEEEVVFPVLDEKAFKLPSFVWMHYYFIVLEIECVNDTKLVFREGADSAEVKLSVLNDSPLYIKLNAKNDFHVRLYSEWRTGSLSIEPKTAVAGETKPYVIRYIVGPEGLSKGGGIRILTPFSCWGQPELVPGEMIKIHSKEKAAYEANLQTYIRDNRGWVYDIKITEGSLSSGDEILITYTGQSGKGVKAQPYIQEELYFLCWEDSKGTGAFVPLSLKDLAKLSVKAGAAVKFRIKVQQIVKSGKEFEISARTLDKMLNPVFGWDGSANIAVSDEKGKIVDQFGIMISNGFGKAVCSGLAEGTYILKIYSEGFEDEIIVISSKNTDNAPSLYYGEIHGHSEVSDGAFGQEEYFKYGKEIGMLDFCALTDHDWEIVEHPRNKKNNRLEALGDITSAMNSEGEFVTICAYEWMGQEGHMNIYYSADKGNSVYVGKTCLLGAEKRHITAKELMDKFRGRGDVLILPHLSHGFNWTEYDRDLQPVAEIYSQWGYSEKVSVNQKSEGAIDILNKGLRFGFIGGADTHNGMPGQTGYCSKYKVLNHREGLACVYADMLSRGEIFSALKTRHCYAITGEKILLEFHINGTPMGGEVSAGESVRELSFSILAGGTKPLKLVEIVSGGAVISTFDGQGRQIVKIDTSLQRKFAEHEYYYVRITQEDGNMAWSSPIWING